MINIEGKMYFVDYEVVDGEEVSVLNSSLSRVRPLDKGILSNGWVKMAKDAISIKYDHDSFGKISLVPLDYEYNTSDGEQLFIGITVGPNCGRVIHVIKDQDIVKATNRFQNNIMSNYFHVNHGNGRMGITKAEIFKISEYLVLDLEHISAEWNKTIKENYDREEQEKEKALYLELKEKYEPTQQI